MNKFEGKQKGLTTDNRRQPANISAIIIMCLTVAAALAAPSAALASSLKARLDITGELDLAVTEMLERQVDASVASAMLDLRVAELESMGQTVRRSLVDLDERHAVSSDRVKASLLSYLVAEFFTGVDVYRELTGMGERLWKNSNGASHDAAGSGSSWNLNLTVRAGDTGLKASVNSDGLNFGTGKMKTGETVSATVAIRF